MLTALGAVDLRSPFFFPGKKKALGFKKKGNLPCESIPARNFKSQRPHLFLLGLGNGIAG